MEETTVADDIVRDLAECTLWDEDTLCELIERAKRYIQFFPVFGEESK